MKATRFRHLARIVTFVLIAAGLVAMFLQKSPEAVARQYLAMHGVAADKLGMMGLERSEHPVCSRATIVFQVEGSNSPKKLVAELSQPVYFLSWHVVQIHEQAK